MRGAICSWLAVIAAHRTCNHTTSKHCLAVAKTMPTCCITSSYACGIQVTLWRCAFKTLDLSIYYCSVLAGRGHEIVNLDHLWRVCDLTVRCRQQNFPWTERVARLTSVRGGERLNQPIIFFRRAFMCKQALVRTSRRSNQSSMSYDWSWCTCILIKRILGTDVLKLPCTVGFQ